MTQEELTGRFPPLFPTDDTPRTPVEELLEAAFPSYTRGGSLMGWSKLKTAKLCLRMFFWDYVMALVLKLAVRLKQERDDDRPKRVNPLALGTVVHACIENMYRAGSISEAFAPCEVIKAQHPDVALEARRLVQFYIDTYNADEVARWDLRAVERESRYYFPARKVQGKRRSLCVSCRHDGIYREMQPGDGHLPRGARADGVHLHEVKTTASLTAGRLRQFFQNAQLQMQLLCYNHGLAVKRTGDVLAVSNADIIGPAIAVTVTEIGKQKRQDPNLDMARLTFYIPEERVLAFRDDIADWYHEEIADRLFHEAWQDARTWRKDWQCFDVMYPSWSCPYLSLCEAGDDVDWTTSYEQRVGEGLLPEQLELPPKLAKVKRVRAAAAPTGEGK